MDTRADRSFSPRAFLQPIAAPSILALMLKGVLGRMVLPVGMSKNKQRVPEVVKGEGEKRE